MIQFHPLDLVRIYTQIITFFASSLELHLLLHGKFILSPICGYITIVSNIHTTLGRMHSIRITISTLELIYRDSRSIEGYISGLRKPDMIFDGVTAFDQVSTNRLTKLNFVITLPGLA